MDGKANSLRWLSDAKKLEVPFFQRPYVWDNENFESLIESFTDVPSNTMPFFGSVILKKLSSDDNEEYLVIDGQQRITTFNVLIRALLDIKQKFSTTVSPIVELTLKGYVYHIDVDEDGNEKFTTKLIPSNPDKKSFTKVMDSTVSRPLDLADLSNSPIENAYKYFYSFFSSAENLDLVKKFFMKLYSDNNSIIYIILDGKDDEQKIFDSVNSLGKTLSNSDIIKNYLFQKMREQAGSDEVKLSDITDIYNKYWDSVFYDEGRKDFWYKEITIGRFKTDNLECFLRDLGVIKEIYASKKTTGTYGLCNAYKKHIDNLSSEELKAFVIEINEYAKVYYDYKTGYENTTSFAWSDSLNRLLLILDYLETTTFNPYILKLLKDRPDNLEEKLYNFERFFLIRFIFEGKTKNYNQCCENLIKATDDAIFFDQYMEESPVLNNSYKTKLRSLTNKQGTLFLFLLEMLSRNGHEDLYSDTLNIHSYTLEHILPQKWQSNKDWLDSECFDESGQKVDKNNSAFFPTTRNAAVRSIGNFTLLTSKLNTSVSNSSFKVKIEGNGKKNGYGIRKYASSLSLTKAVIDVYDQTGVWNEKNVFQNEKDYYNKLNEFYCFE